MPNKSSNARAKKLILEKRLLFIPRRVFSILHRVNFTVRRFAVKLKFR